MPSGSACVSPVHVYGGLVSTQAACHGVVPLSRISTRTDLMPEPLSDAVAVMPLVPCTTGSGWVADTTGSVLSMSRVTGTEERALPTVSTATARSSRLPSVIPVVLSAQERDVPAPVHSCVHVGAPGRRYSRLSVATPAPASLAVALIVFTPESTPGSVSVTVGPVLSTTRAANVAVARVYPAVSRASARRSYVALASVEESQLQLYGALVSVHRSVQVVVPAGAAWIRTLAMPRSDAAVLDSATTPCRLVPGSAMETATVLKSAAEVNALPGVAVAAWKSAPDAVTPGTHSAAIASTSASRRQVMPAAPRCGAWPRRPAGATARRGWRAR